MDSDTIKLIEEVHKYRSLWDQRSTDYVNRSVKMKEWALVALEMDCTVDNVKSRWKALKDSFIQELKVSAKSGQPSRWNYFDNMYFLTNGLNKLLLPRAYRLQSRDEHDSAYASTFSCENKTSESSLLSPEEDAAFMSSQRKRVKISSSNGREILNSTPLQSNPAIEWNGFHPENSNEDYYFFMSLLPSFERMSAQQKMVVKIKIMQDVYNAAFEDSTHNLSCSTSSGIEAFSTLDPPGS